MCRKPVVDGDTHLQYLESHPLQVDSEGDNDSCLLCRGTGTLLLCDECPHSLHHSCMINIQGYRRYAADMAAEKFKCWTCDQEALEALKVTFCGQAAKSPVAYDATQDPDEWVRRNCDAWPGDISGLWAETKRRQDAARDA